MMYEDDELEDYLEEEKEDDYIDEDLAYEIAMSLKEDDARDRYYREKYGE